mmetsp:Transcript_6275/g.17047  ORF Transcript_6275/g.17047 Transcript_6275/m.17047 type:complete len:94 (+) Transcript_6275:414-695(+)
MALVPPDEEEEEEATTALRMSACPHTSAASKPARSASRLLLPVHIESDRYPWKRGLVTMFVVFFFLMLIATLSAFRAIGALRRCCFSCIHFER